MKREALEQIAVMKWARFHPIAKNYLIAIPNGGSRHPLEARNLRLQGVKAGVSDLFLAYPVPPLCGLWIEMKRPKPYRSHLSDAQVHWLKSMQHVGYGGCVAYGSVDAITAILNYLKGNRA